MDHTGPTFDGEGIEIFKMNSAGRREDGEVEVVLAKALREVPYHYRIFELDDRLRKAD